MPELNEESQVEDALSVYRTILVVGGGIAGITAALEAAEAGYEVLLSRKNPI